MDQRADDQRPDLSRITRNPLLLSGKPAIRGLRISVSTVLGLLASGVPESEILEMYPFLEAEDIRAALAYAARRCDRTRIRRAAS